MAEERTCGGCTACCKVYAIHELKKPVGQWCRHCEIGKGCGVYDMRPQECADYKCAWLCGMGGEEFRPDKIDIVPDYKLIPGFGPVLWMFGVKGGALRTDVAKRWTLNNLYVGTSVLHIPLIMNPRLIIANGSAFPAGIPTFNGKRVEGVTFQEYARESVRPAQ